MRVSKCPPLRRVCLQVEILEDRTTPATLSAHETYALAVINHMRENPTAFAAEIRSLYQGGNYQSSHGFSANDPIWADLRATIDEAESATWQSGFHSSGAGTWLSVMSTLPALPALAWDSGLQDGAAAHNQWMFNNYYAHSVFTAGAPAPAGESPAYPIPGIARNFSVAQGDYFNWSGLNRAGENVSYAYNVLANTVNAYRAGQITLDGFYQRLVYSDVIGFIMEYHNGNLGDPWGHLENLTADRSNPAFTFSLIGLSDLIYENPVEGEIGTPQSYFGTHRLGHRTGRSFANVLVYHDLNGNNFYDAGEGLAAQVADTAAGVFNLGGTGYATYELTTATSMVTVTYNGELVGTQNLTRDGSNKNLIFKVGAPGTPPTTPSPPAPRLAVAPTGGGQPVLFFNSAGVIVGSLVPFTGFAGQTKIAQADVNGDGFNDLVASTGSGADHVKVFDGTTGTLIRSFLAFGGYQGGVNVSSGDVNGDGFADIVISSGGIGTPHGHVKVFDGQTGAEFRSFYSFLGFSGVVNTAAADVTGDGRADLIVATAMMADHVKVFDGVTGAEVYSFLAFGGFTGGLTVAGGDVNGDGRAEILIGAGFGAPGGHVKVFDGASRALLHSFFAYAGAYLGGARVAAVDLDNDAIYEIVTAPGPGAGPHVKRFNGLTLQELNSFFAYAPDFTQGIFIA